MQISQVTKKRETKENGINYGHFKAEHKTDYGNVLIALLRFFLLVITKLCGKLGENPTPKIIPRCSWAQSQTQNDL